MRGVSAHSGGGHERTGDHTLTRQRVECGHDQDHDQEQSQHGQDQAIPGRGGVLSLRLSVSLPAPVLMQKQKDFAATHIQQINERPWSLPWVNGGGTLPAGTGGTAASR